MAINGHGEMIRNGAVGGILKVNMEVGDILTHRYQSWPYSRHASCQKVVFGGQQYLTRGETETEVMIRLGFPEKFCLSPTHPLLAPVSVLENSLHVLVSSACHNKVPHMGKL